MAVNTKDNGKARKEIAKLDWVLDRHITVLLSLLLVSLIIVSVRLSIKQGCQNFEHGLECCKLYVVWVIVHTVIGKVGLGLG